MKKKGNILHFDNRIYEKRNRYKNPKENFKKLIKLLKKEKKKKDLKLLDVGCSNGELLYNLKKNIKRISLYGIDIDQNLIMKAKKICPKDIKFKKGDIFKGIKGLTGVNPRLQLYQVHAVTQGTDAQAEVTVRLEEDGKTVNGQGADTDTMVASARAYINALNKLLVKRQKTLPSAMSA